DIVTSGVRECLPALVAIVVIAILYNMLFGLTEGFVGKSTVEVVHLVCYAAILATVVSLVVGVVSDVRETADRQVNLLGVGTPPLMALTTVLGGSVSSGVLKPQLALFSTLLARIIAAVVIPLFIVSVVLSVVGNLSDNVRLGKLVSAVRYLIGCVLGVSFGLYTTYLTVAGVAGSMADTVSIRAARYVIGNYVPLVGGYISQGFDLVATSLSLIKNALGAYAMILTVAVVLRPLVKVLLLTVGLKLVAGLIQPVGDQRMASMVGSVADCMRSLTAATAGVGFAFLVTMLLVMSSTTMVL
ncbi:MAG: stage III sporulation protein AE, partial [Clostridia bacterium]|nr:stage III sporulation protein AE [Clostridia bacterium]